MSNIKCSLQPVFCRTPHWGHQAGSTEGRPQRHLLLNMKWNTGRLDPFSLLKCHSDLLQKSSYGPLANRDHVGLSPAWSHQTSVASHAVKVYMSFRWARGRETKISKGYPKRTFEFTLSPFMSSHRPGFYNVAATHFIRKCCSVNRASVWRTLDNQLNEDPPHKTTKQRALMWNIIFFHH